MATGPRWLNDTADGISWGNAGSIPERCIWGLSEMYPICVVQNVRNEISSEKSWFGESQRGAGELIYSVMQYRIEWLLVGKR